MNLIELEGEKKMMFLDFARPIRMTLLLAIIVFCAVSCVSIKTMPIIEVTGKEFDREFLFKTEKPKVIFDIDNHSHISQMVYLRLKMDRERDSAEVIIDGQAFKIECNNNNTENGKHNLVIFRDFLGKFKHIEFRYAGGDGNYSILYYCLHVMCIDE